jgi:hypothetical protein
MVSACYDGQGGINITRTRHHITSYMHTYIVCLVQSYFRIIPDVIHPLLASMG